MTPALPVAALWPSERLEECVLALLENAALVQAGTGRASGPGIGTPKPEEIGTVVSRIAERVSCAAMPVETSRRELRKILGTTAPALLALPSGALLAIAEARRGRLRCVQMDGSAVSIGAREICLASETAADTERRERFSGILNRSQVGGARVIDSLMDETTGQAPFHGLWVFRAGSGGPAGNWIKNSGVLAKSISLLLAHFAQYAVWVTSWALLGSVSFTGHMDGAWLFAWALLLATVVPCRALATWLQGVISILLGGELKRRVLQGALKLTPDEVRTDGIGAFLGQALEAEALESLALGGGIVGLLALVDLAVCSLLLGKLALLLFVWLLLAVIAAAFFLRSFGEWSGERLAMTQDLVEAMVGQRTRLAQLQPEHWHRSEDQALTSYLASSQRVDRIGGILVAAVPRGWLLAAIAFLAPQIISGQTGGGALAVAVGGTLLAYTAFDRLVNSFSEIAAAWVAWRRAGFLFRAAARPDTHGVLAIVGTAEPQVPVLEADGLEFRYHDGGRAVLEACNLSIWRGDRILLEGASGSGKTTLAALLSGTRQPKAGLLLSGGLDIHSLGEEGWRDRIVSAPQFHDNHIVTETLAFNLLMGKRWPAHHADFAEAEEVCRRLGLGDLLDRMPSGLLQLVGDGGWQLSHGERSRVFIARALLQNPELIILDESFGSLDPETLQSALEFTLERAQTLLLIAHP